jgi:hypothetical protein
MSSPRRSEPGRHFHFTARQLLQSVLLHVAVKTQACARRVLKWETNRELLLKSRALLKSRVQQTWLSQDSDELDGRLNELSSLLEKEIAELACEVRLLKGKGGVPCNSAKSDDPADLVMPEIGLKLLPFIVPKKLRENVGGDLDEDFRTYAAHWGRPYALRWLWWELAGLCIRRFGPSAIIMGIGVWFRQKIGW